MPEGRDQFLVRVHGRAEFRPEPGPTCFAGTRIKPFACAIYSERQLDDKIADAKSCGACDEFTRHEARAGVKHWRPAVASCVSFRSGAENSPPAYVTQVSRFRH